MLSGPLRRQGMELDAAGNPWSAEQAVTDCGWGWPREGHRLTDRWMRNTQAKPVTRKEVAPLVTWWVKPRWCWVPKSSRRLLVRAKRLCQDIPKCGAWHEGDSYGKGAPWRQGVGLESLGWLFWVRGCARVNFCRKCWLVGSLVWDRVSCSTGWPVIPYFNQGWACSSVALVSPCKCCSDWHAPFPMPSLCSAEDWTQGFMNAGQACYQLSWIPSPCLDSGCDPGFPRTPYHPGCLWHWSGPSTPASRILGL